MIVLRTVFLEGGSYRLLFPQYWPMAVIGLVSLTLAAWLFRRRMYYAELRMAPFPPRRCRRGRFRVRLGPRR